MSVYFTNRRKTTDALTDYENGYLNGRHSAFNDVLRSLEIMIRDANDDWNNTHCREENNAQETLFDINTRLFSDPVDFSLNKLINDIKINPTQNTRFCLGIINRVREIWKKIKIHGIETCGLTYDEFLNQLESKHIIFFTDKEAKDYMKSKEIIKLFNSINNIIKDGE